MKKTDLIQKIKESAINEMPDVMDRIDISKIQIDEPETVKSPFNLKRTVSLTFASLFLILSGVFTYNFAYLPNVTNTSPLESNTELIGFQTVSSASLLSTFDITELSFNENNFVVQELSETSFDLEDNIDLVNKYLSLAETVLGSQEQFIYEAIESDNPDYEYAYQYKGVDLAGNLIQYRWFYNEIEVEGNTNQIGILMHNQTQYHFSMITTSPNDVPVTRYHVGIDDQNYIQVLNFSTKYKQRFNYKVYVNGELDNESELILSSKKGTLSAQINIKNRLNEEIDLDIQRETLEGEMQQFNVQYRLKSQNQKFNGEFNVNLEMNQATQMYQYKYKINNQQVIIEDRPTKGNEKAKDDDFTSGNYNGPVTTAQPTTTQESTQGSGNSPTTGNNPTTNNNPTTGNNPTTNNNPTTGNNPTTNNNSTTNNNPGNSSQSTSNGNPN